MSKKKTFTEQERAALIQRYLAGESHTALARATGTSRFVIRREIGPPLRTCREAGRLPYPDSPGARINALQIRVRELEAVLALLAADENWDWDYMNCVPVWLYRDAKGQKTYAQVIARAALDGEG